MGLFYSDEKYERTFYRIKYSNMFKSNISDVYSLKYMKIEINSDDNLPLEKTLDMHVVMLIKITFNKNHIAIKRFSKNVHINNL